MNAQSNAKSRIPDLLNRHQASILPDWIQKQSEDRGPRKHRMTEAEMREESRGFLAAVVEASQRGKLDDLSGPEWSEVRDRLMDISQSRAKAGFSPSETARFVFSLKQAVFPLLQKEYESDPKALAEETWTANMLVDNLGLLTTESYTKAREEVVIRQQQELLELSTPVVKLWEGIVAVPLIGTLDSERTQIVMESLLQQVVETGASIAIIDITGVPTVDTLVAQHLLKTIAAARLMGADCIISGIRPQIAATIVHLGVDLGNVITKSSLADAFALALRRLGLTVKAQQTAYSRKEDYGTDTDS
jgi:rsbT co-antagonist protein RsbR